MKIEIESILISEAQIQERVRELGQQISEDYSNREPVLVCVLKGAALFFADLFRTLSIPVRCEFIQLSSYDDRTESSGHVRTVQGLNGNLRNADVVVVEDIVDTGHTLSFLMEEIEALEPASVKVCSLLNKPTRRIVSMPIDYVGFEIPDAFVVGYGLDYAQKYRNLREIYHIKT